MLHALPENQTSNISALPTELLAQIFSFVACPVKEGTKPTSRIFSSTYGILPWRLSAVCRLWRQIMITHSRLWSNLLILFSSNGCCSPPLETLQIWTERAGPQPLTVALTTHLPEYELGFRETLPLETLKFLREIVCHAEALYFQIQTPIGVRSSMDRSELKHNLKSLGPLLPSNFAVLKRFSWYGSSTRFTQYPLPWSQLEEVSLEAYDGAILNTKTCLDMVKRCTTLKTFSANIIDDFGPVYDGAIIECSLAELDLGGTPYAFKSFFEETEICGLADLSLSERDPYDEAVDQPEIIFPELILRLTSLFKANHDTLRALHLSRIDIPPPQLLHLLQLVPSLRVLDLQRGPCVDKNIISAMTVFPDAPIPLCPVLSEFKFQSFLTDIPDGWVARMVESRVEGSPMSSISLPSDLSHPESGDALRLRALELSGKLNFLGFFSG
ncbi:hypothetical protein ONZ45_g17724 [Pleurotus djamor]|nr:hypothetical protein ONZ45_g17724 [Pleurotus djamor]